MNFLPDHFRATGASSIFRKSHQTKAGNQINPLNPLKFAQHPKQILPFITVIHCSFHLRLSTIFFLLLLLFVAFPHHPLVEGAEGVEHCPQWVGDEIQFCVQPVAEFARNLNQQQVEKLGIF